MLSLVSTNFHFVCIEALCSQWYQPFLELLSGNEGSKGLCLGSVSQVVWEWIKSVVMRTIGQAHVSLWTAFKALESERAQ